VSVDRDVEQTQQAYTYAGDNPANGADPSGEYVCGPTYPCSPLGNPYQTLAERTEYAYEWLKVAGAFAPFQSAGILGNLLYESWDTLDPTIWQVGCDYASGVPCGRGIAQWTDPGPRWSALIDFAQTMFDSTSLVFPIQVQFVWHELTGTYRVALNALRNATNVTAATWAIDDIYEGPLDPSSTLAPRVAYAKQVLTTYG
jgi:hypothetical protein